MLPIFFVLSALVALLCAVTAIYCWQRCAAALAEVHGIVSALRGMRSKTEAHDSAIEQLAEDFRSLRGKFYAERRKAADNGSEAESGSAVDRKTVSVADLKANLRKQVGLLPGRAP